MERQLTSTSSQTGLKKASLRIRDMSQSRNGIYGEQYACLVVAQPSGNRVQVCTGKVVSMIR